MNLKKKILLLWVIFALLDPDPLIRLNPDPIRIRNPAPRHLHFGGTCCYSCRTFFRRTAIRHKDQQLSALKCKAGTGDCVIDRMFNRDCIGCRFRKCLSVGMRVDLVIRRREGESLGESLPRLPGGNIFIENVATGSGGDCNTGTTSEEPLTILGSATGKR